MLGSTEAASCEQYSTKQDFLSIRHEIILREELECQNLLVDDVFCLKKERFGTSTGLIRQVPEFSGGRGEYGSESRMFLKMETEAATETFEFCFELSRLTVHYNCEASECYTKTIQY
jgi:hypothetical protein